MLAQYCSLLALFPQCASELLLNTVEILKNFNSRTCQLILGAGALQLIGLKTISVKHMALAARCLQLIARFIPVVRTNFAAKLPEKSHQQLRHFDTTLRDYNDHFNEINSKLLAVVDQHLISALNEVGMMSALPLNSSHLVGSEADHGTLANIPANRPRHWQVLQRLHQHYTTVSNCGRYSGWQDAHYSAYFRKCCCESTPTLSVT